MSAEPVVRSVVIGILSRAGYAGAGVDTVQAAIEIMKTPPVDLVLTNVNLPGITGHDAMRLLKGLHPGVPVLMVSGLPDADVIREWTGREGFDTFPKPFKAQELVNKVRAMLSGHAGPAICNLAKPRL